MNARKQADRFTLAIDLGNDAMQTGSDLANTLRDFAGGLYLRDALIPDSGNIRDVSGNTVGSWQLFRRKR